MPNYDSQTILINICIDLLVIVYRVSFCSIWRLNMNYSTLSSVLVIVAFCITLQTHATENKPNIVIIIADDLGYGDVGCFGNTTLRTPNIDRIAKEGALLRHHLAASSMCSPSRTALLTGRYPIRSGIVNIYNYLESQKYLRKVSIKLALLVEEVNGGSTCDICNV